MVVMELELFAYQIARCTNMLIQVLAYMMFTSMYNLPREPKKTNFYFCDIFGFCWPILKVFPARRYG